MPPFDHFDDLPASTPTVRAEVRAVMTAALRDRMRLLHEAAANARHLGCEDAAQVFLRAHSEASDVLAGIEAGT